MSIRRLKDCRKASTSSPVKVSTVQATLPTLPPLTMQPTNGSMPCSMQTAQKTSASPCVYFHAGLYPNSLICNVGENGKLRIGVKKTTTISEDWTIFDNFTLTYIPEEEPDGIQSIRPIHSPKGIYTLQGIKIEEADLQRNGIYIIDGKATRVE